METTPNGSLEAHKKHHAEALSFLDKYFTTNLVKRVNISSKVEQIMDVEHEELSKASAEVLGEWAILLAKYSYYVQRLLNEENAIEELAANKIKKIIFKDFNQYKSGKYETFEEVRAKAIEGNEAAKIWERVRVNALFRVKALAELPKRIEKMSDKLDNLQRTKSRWTPHQ